MAAFPTISEGDSPRGQRHKGATLPLALCPQLSGVTTGSGSLPHGREIQGSPWEPQRPGISHLSLVRGQSHSRPIPPAASPSGPRRPHKSSSLWQALPAVGDCFPQAGRQMAHWTRLAAKWERTQDVVFVLRRPSSQPQPTVWEGKEGALLWASKVCPVGVPFP